VEVARRIAKAIRYSSGGFRYVKAMGVPLASRNLAQVSMNLTDFEQTPIHRVFESVRAEAARWGTAIAGSEIIGLIPKKALEMTAEWYLQAENFRPDMVLENRLAAESTSGGLNDFLEELAAPSATPGGGSAAAAAAAMAASLGAMVSRLAKLPAESFETGRQFFAAAVLRDSESYNAVVKAYKRPKEERAPYVEAALEGAARVPLEVAEESAALRQLLQTLAETAPKKFGSDIETALALADAAMAGAVANVGINIASMKDEARAAAIRARLEALVSGARAAGPRSAP
jgi:formiminotetrahydrofolate cyclodeaminase